MILIIDCGSTKVPEIFNLVDNFDECEIVKMEELKTIDTKKYDGVIISGAPILLTEVENEPFLEKFQWIKSFAKPILGICFGHQILGLLYGAEVARQHADRDWNLIGKLNVDEPLFAKLPLDFEMMEDHCENVSIPPKFIHLAGSDTCVNEAMRHPEKNFYGIQFHPEVSGNAGAIIFDNFVRICLEKKVN